MELTPIQARVLGALIEKEITTPEYYPLSLNALLAASNQKSSRDPVMSLVEGDIRSALRDLEDADLVSTTHDTRVPRYENRARTVFNLRRDETAVLCLLLLRGPQTPGELRQRSDRLFSFDDIPAVLSALNRLAEREESLVTVLPRQSGSKESRYAHLLCGPVEIDAVNPVPREAGESLAMRVQRLEEEVSTLRLLLERLLPGNTEETGSKTELDV
ncbi:YceH family protein [Terriglobus saanensis]|uniref:Uncharacterized protein n=1 Tax=Terriglobus saanensis (strain ATCC BAA-1853 / DSM 23119 / SP1PR4) TaxID=401053 RepID=E8V2W4_TERSS|nr:YceH family protein [Terriglobus saanensis]ADV84661.1 protein of unknown function DUF480 [Terriglobus saanensis SP1PR4]